MFDLEFEEGYPGEMPKTVLQRHFFNDMLYFHPEDEPIVSSQHGMSPQSLYA